MMGRRHLLLTALVVLTAWPGEARGASIVYQDPSGDDFGPGSYTYPTASEYTKGSFDLRKVELRARGAKVEIKVTLGANIEDPWDSAAWDGQGFSLQMVQIYLDIDGKPGSGHTDTLPGIHAGFAPEDAWDRMVIISPQGRSRLRAEVKQKASAMAAAIVIPTKVKVRGRTLIATVKKSALGGAPRASWGLQAVMQSNEGFPKGTDLLSRRVNEYPGQHRFGGGNDRECDPHVLDILVSPAQGGDAEAEGQKAALAYSCGPDGESVRQAVLPMVRLE